MEKNKIYISYAEFESRLKILYNQIRVDILPDLIIGIDSGGTNISKPLHNWLGLKHQHESVYISCYNNDKLSNIISILPLPEYINQYENVLLVDDIIDSGTTINCFLENTKLIHGVNLKIATLYWNPNNKYNITPDYYVEKKIEDDVWITFPWEFEYTERFNNKNK